MKRLLTALALVAAAAAQAAAPYALTYQGVLRDARGAAFPADHRAFDVTFRLYRTSDLAEALWGRTLPVRLDADGLFNVVLDDAAGTPVAGEPAPLYDTLSNVFATVTSGDLFIGLTPADASEELRPRQKVLAAPTALRALDATDARASFDVAGTASAARFEAATGTVSDTLSATRLTVKEDLFAGGRITVREGVSVRGPASVTGASRVSGDVRADAALAAEGFSATDLAATDVKAGGLAAASLARNGVLPTAPRGLIVLWYGAVDDIPEGWKLCDGQNGTPDLRGRFPVGAGGSYSPGDKGGANTVALSAAQMPKHSHNYSFYHTGYLLAWYDAQEVTTNTKGGTYDKTTGSAGSGSAHENRPRFRAVYYIMKVR